jgi:hypothetical protein
LDSKLPDPATREEEALIIPVSQDLVDALGDEIAELGDNGRTLLLGRLETHGDDAVGCW